MLFQQQPLHAQNNNTTINFDITKSMISKQRKKRKIRSLDPKEIPTLLKDGKPPKKDVDFLVLLKQ